MFALQLDNIFFSKTFLSVLLTQSHKLSERTDVEVDKSKVKSEVFLSNSMEPNSTFADKSCFSHVSFE